MFLFWPALIFMHGFLIFFLRKWLGPLGTLYSAWGTFLLIFVYLLYLLIYISYAACYLYYDFGRWFICLNILDSHLIFCFDFLALLGSCVVLSLLIVALLFGIEYMFREAFINRLLYLLNLFALSVVLLFIAYDFFLIIVAWEGIGLFSLLLVNFYATRVYTLKAALKTFVFSRISDMFLMITFTLFLLIFNTTDLSIIFIQMPTFLFHYIYIAQYWIHTLSLLAFSLILSGTIKAAQFFFHVWLPDAMEAPTPASALIHSSTLVVAGIFLIMRFSLLFEFTFLVNMFLIWLGSTTLVFAAVTAIMQHDIKKLVAYSTISQIGYLVTGCGYMCYEETLTYLVVHAYNKALLFILVGYLVHFFNGNTDMRFMGGVYVYILDIAILIFFLGFNLTGAPYSAGFIAKEFLLFQMWTDSYLALYAQLCWLISFFFTPIYMYYLTFNVLFNFKRANISSFAIFFNWATTFMFVHRNVQTQISFVTGRCSAIILVLFFFLFNNSGDLYYLFLYNYIYTGAESFIIYFTSSPTPALSVLLLNTSFTAFLTYIIYYNIIFVMFYLLKNLYYTLRYLN